MSVDKNKIAEEVGTVYNYRLEMLDKNFGDIEKGDMSDEEYRKALEEQYVALRNKEFEYAAKAQGYDMYNFSRNMSIDECKGQMFQKTGARANALLDRETDGIDFNPDTYFTHEEKNDSTWRANVNSAVFSAHEVVDDSRREVGVYTRTSDLSHCAQTAACIATATCKSVGLGDVTDRAEVCNAAGIHGGRCVSDRLIVEDKSTGRNIGIGQGQYSNLDAYNQGKTLGELVESGEIGPGTIISEYSPGTTSKMHALTVTAVHRNEIGLVDGYTVMDNNGGNARTRIRQCKINGDDPVSISCNKKRVAYTSIGDLANDQFTKETEGKSIEELQTMITDKREETKGVIRYLAETEKTLLCDETYKQNCGGGIRANILGKEQSNMVDFYLKDENREARFHNYMKDMAVGVQDIDFTPPQIEMAPIKIPEFEIGKKGKLNVKGWVDVDISENKSQDDKPKTIKDEMKEQRNEAEAQLAKNEEIIRSEPSHKGEEITENARKVVKSFMKRDEDKSHQTEEEQRTITEDLASNKKIKSISLNDLMRMQSQVQQK